MRTDLVSTVAKFGLYTILGVLFLLFAILGGTWWWLDPQHSWMHGALYIVLLWGWMFNRLPTQGLACLKNEFNMRFIFPLAILSSIGFAIGFFR